MVSIQPLEKVLADLAGLVLILGIETSVDQTNLKVEFVDKMLAGKLSSEDAGRFAALPPETIAFTMLLLQQRIAQSHQAGGANQPSATFPPYQEPDAGEQSRQKKRPRGTQPGHQGTRRPTPTPNRTRKHQCNACPDCGGKLKRTGDRRERLSEDIPEDIKSVVNKDVIHRDYCSQCQKRIEPRVPNVLPYCTPATARWFSRRCFIFCWG